MWPHCSLSRLLKGWEVGPLTAGFVNCRPMCRQAPTGANMTLLLQGTKFGRASRAEMSGVFSFLETCLEQIVKDNELGALQQVIL